MPKVPILKARNHLNNVILSFIKHFELGTVGIRWQDSFVLLCLIDKFVI